MNFTKQIWALTVSHRILTTTVSLLILHLSLLPVHSRGLTCTIRFTRCLHFSLFSTVLSFMACTLSSLRIFIPYENSSCAALQFPQNPHCCLMMVYSIFAATRVSWYSHEIINKVFRNLLPDKMLAVPHISWNLSILIPISLSHCRSNGSCYN